MNTAVVATSQTRILTQTAIGIEGAHDVEEHIPHAMLTLDDDGVGMIAICNGADQSVFDADDIDALLTVLNRAVEIRDGLRGQV